MFEDNESADRSMEVIFVGSKSLLVRACLATRPRVNRSHFADIHRLTRSDRLAESTWANATCAIRNDVDDERPMVQPIAT